MIAVRNWLDRVTGRVTMYRLVNLVLSALLVIAIAAGAIGQVSYAPLDILVAAAVAVVVTFASSWLFAKLFRTRAHLESSLITGLLLAFLFRPTLDGAELGSIALAAVIASASKYLLAIRRRHIFNPAAIGAFIVSLTGLNFAVWWAGTPALLPFVIIGAFLVLYRSHRLVMGSTFVVLAVALFTLQYSLGGMAVGAALWSAVGSSPVVFLAGFMLSEPLTLPPRRWQQLGLAVVVALLLTTPFSFPPLYNSPELALVVGNVLAFAVGQRRGIRMDYLGRTQLTPTSWEFSFRPQRAVRYVPGQYMELSVPHSGADQRGHRRVFSIASAPGGDVRFGLRIAEKSSSFKTSLLTLEPGEIVTGTSIAGDFVLPRDAQRPLLLVAGGIGITPFVSQLEHLETTGAQRDVVIVYASSSPDEIAYAERIASGGHRVLLVSPTEPADLPSTWTWLGAGPLTGDLLLKSVADAAQRDAFVSGAPALVTSMKQALRRAGVRHVKSDYFSGY